MEADISIWRKPGHFYFALTRAHSRPLFYCSSARGCSSACLFGNATSPQTESRSNDSLAPLIHARVGLRLISRNYILERATGIEPVSKAWEASNITLKRW